MEIKKICGVKGAERFLVADNDAVLLSYYSRSLLAHPSSYLLRSSSLLSVSHISPPSLPMPHLSSLFTSPSSLSLLSLSSLASHISLSPQCASEALIISLRTFFCTLPVDVLGSASTTLWRRNVETW